MMISGASRRISVRLYPNEPNISGPGQKILLPDTFELVKPPFCHFFNKKNAQLLDVATKKLGLNKAARYLVFFLAQKFFNC